MRHVDAIDEGRRVAFARGMDGDRPPNVASFGEMNAAILEMLPDDDLRRRCDELLQDHEIS